ncbi:MAG TPA: hypothetical protein VMS64_33965 [Candidatus Methylomirabilis sp.]|nr:hypothetical protein [Candidatus Methylomirabilis sp.]
MRHALQNMAWTPTTEPLIVRIGVIALMIFQVGLSALAVARPVDPSWIPGIYGDADYDDVVALATSGTGNGGPVVPALLRPGPALIGHLLGCSEPAALVRSAPALSPRAPPAT